MILAMDDRRERSRVPWKLAAAWMTFLGPFFFLIYGTCNWINSQRLNVGSFSWTWEESIPFVPAMIIPYMSLDLFFAGSAFVCRSRIDLHALARRIVFAILVAGGCFLLFPLRIAFVRPATSGLYGQLFGWLTLDQPYNLVPSLHIALRSIVWVPYSLVLRGVAKSLLGIWFALIGFSTLLTYQHQALDVICGEILAVLTLYLIPAGGLAPISFHRFRNGPLNGRVGLVYAAFAVSLAAEAYALRPWGVFLLWPAVSLALVSAGYFGAGTAIFQKRDGALSWPARIVLAPYLAGKLLSNAIYHRLGPGYAEVAPNLLVGSWMAARNREKFDRLGRPAVLDLTAECNEWRHVRAQTYKNVAILDLTLPPIEDVHEAVAFVRRHAQAGPVYVHCALGFSRSAGIAAAYLLATGAARSPEEAVAKIRAARPRIVLRRDWMELLRQFAQAT